MSLETPLRQQPHASYVLAKGCDILDELGVMWWLSAGTMLGLHRDGGFIPHDTDLDVGTLETAERFDEIDDAYFSQGFRLIRAMPCQRAYIYLGTIFDIYSFKRDGDKLLAEMDGLTQVKKWAHFENLGEIEFEGRKYPTPNPVEDYLETRYGPTWKIPKTKKDPWWVDTINVVQ